MVDYLVPLAIAVVFLGGGIAKMLHDRHMAAFGDFTTAQVVDCVVKAGQWQTDGPARSHYYPILRFRTRDGRDVIARLPYEYDPKYAPKGQFLTVRYDVLDPENVEITARDPKSWGSIAMMAVGLGIGIFCLVQVFT